MHADTTEYRIMKVCITEKPSVAQSIAKILGATSRHDGYMEGNGYQVTWAFGHLCELNAPEDYNPEWKHWKMDALPIVPGSFAIKLINDKGVKKQFAIIKKLFSKATEIINCGDAGQEGELIQRWIQQLSGNIKCPIKRLWISSLTDESIREGFRHLRPQSDFDNLYEAGLARAKADWLLGMNATRLYTIKYGGYGQVLSLGRVQTPTLGMVVKRTLEIQGFKPEPYWVLSTNYRNVVFTVSSGKITSKQAADAALASILSKTFQIVEIQKKAGKESAPQLYDLTALQVDCNRRYGFSAEKTLQTLQSLYEKKLTTYPRVDTRYLSDDIYAKCPSILSSLTGYAQFIALLKGLPLPKSSRVFNSAKVTDHHAIIPTGQHPEALTQSEQQVYDLICRRFIAVFLPDCQISTTAVLGKCGDVGFKATGKEILSPGWKAVYASLSQHDDESEKHVQILPSFVKGEYGSHIPSVQEKQTTPPKPYSDASLLQTMETAGRDAEDETLREAMKENGIGRPSSRAAIIEKIITRGYVQRTGKSLIATPKGIELIGLIHEPLLKSCETTGYWEKHLREIERGKYNPDTFLAELITQLRNIILRVKDAPAATVHAFIPVRESLVTRNRSFSGRSASRRARR